MEGRKTSVLFVAYLYPPGAPVGFERVVKFRKHLAELGYFSCVVTTGVWGRLADDECSRVYRAFDPVALYQAALSLVFRQRSLGSGTRSLEEALAGSSVARVVGWLRDWVVVPDRSIGWLPFAIWAGVRAIRRHETAVIVATSGPPTNLLVGACLSVLSGVPLVVDFRDGWLYESIQPVLRRSGYRRALDGALERWVVSRSRCVVTVSEPLTTYFRETYRLPDARATTITNGYDADDWTHVRPVPRSEGKLRIVHTGALSASRPSLSGGGGEAIRQLLDGIARLAPEVRSRFEVLFVGQSTAAETQAVVGSGFDGIIQFVPPVTRPLSLGYQLSADVLLLVAGGDRSVATSKLYEYLYARRPILAIGDLQGAACQIVRLTKAGMAADWAEPGGIGKALHALFVLWRSGGLEAYGQGDIGRFDRRVLARQLAVVLDRVTARSNR